MFPKLPRRRLQKSANQNGVCQACGGKVQIPWIRLDKHACGPYRKPRQRLSCLSTFLGSIQAKALLGSLNHYLTELGSTLFRHLDGLADRRLVGSTRRRIKHFPRRHFWSGRRLRKCFTRSKDLIGVEFPKQPPAFWLLLQVKSGTEVLAAFANRTKHRLLGDKLFFGFSVCRNLLSQFQRLGGIQMIPLARWCASRGHPNMLGSDFPEHIMQFCSAMKSGHVPWFFTKSNRSQSQLGALVGQLTLFRAIHVKKVSF